VEASAGPVEVTELAGTCGKGNVPVNETPEIVRTKAWHGKDGKLIEEDELSLERTHGK